MNIKLLKNSFIKNVLIVLTGDGLSSILGIISLSLIINQVGLEFNGILIVVQTYCMLFNDIFNFQSFNAIIKFLPSYIKKDNKEKIKSCIKLALVLDISSSILAFTFGHICLSLFATFMKWDIQIVNYIRVYLIIILFNITGTSVGVLRIYNKFNIIAKANVITAILKLMLYVVGSITNKTLSYYIDVEMLTFIIRNLYILMHTYNVLKINNLQKFYKKKIIFNKEFFMFNFYSNIVSTLDLPIGHITTFMINKFLGFSDISIYKVFEKFGSIISRVCASINQALYPELSFMIAKKEHKKTLDLVRKIFYLVSALGIISIIVTATTHKLWLGLYLKNESKYIWIFLFYLLTITIINSTIGVNQLYMALGYIKYSVPIITICNIVYLLIFYYLVNNMGILGIIISILIQAIMVISCKIFVILKYSNYIRGYIKRRIV